MYPTFFALNSGNTTFKIVNVGPGQNPYFLLDEETYYVLGSMMCPAGDNVIYNYTQTQFPYYDPNLWYCGTFPGYPLNPNFEVNQVALSCSKWQQVFWHNGFGCNFNSNILEGSSFNNCTFSGSVLKSDGYNNWTCANDLNTIPTLGCVADQMIAWNDETGWGCTDFDDQNLLGSIGSTTTGYVLLAEADGNWTTGPDQDTLGDLVCSTGTLLKNSSGTWTCGPDADAIRYLNCTAGTTVMFNGTLKCAPPPANNAAFPQVFVDGQLLGTSSNTIRVNTYFGSFLVRDSSPFQFSNGFQVLGYGFSLSMDPRLNGDTSFSFSLLLKTPGPTGTVLSSLSLPVGSTSVTSTSFLNFEPGSTGLSLVYSYGGLELNNNVQITSTLLLSVNELVSS